MVIVNYVEHFYTTAVTFAMKREKKKKEKKREITMVIGNEMLKRFFGRVDLITPGMH